MYRKLKISSLPVSILSIFEYRCNILIDGGVIYNLQLTKTRHLCTWDDRLRMKTTILKSTKEMSQNENFKGSRCEAWTVSNSDEKTSHRSRYAVLSVAVEYKLQS